jgi:hypothetical protein
MTQAWFGPLESERAWDDAALAHLPLAVGSSEPRDGLDEVLVGFADDGDLVLTEAPLDGAHAEHLSSHLLGNIRLASWQSDGLDAALAKHAVHDRLRPWAVTPAVSDALAAAGAPHDLPDVDVVRRVNSKVWSAAFRESNTRVVRGSAECEQVGRAMLSRGSIVLKEPYGVSGRGSMQVNGVDRLTRLIRHLRGEEERGARVVLIVEELLDKRVDFSTQLEIFANGRIVSHGVCGMTNRGFAYAGSGRLSGEDERRVASDEHLANIARVTRGLQADGYFGPVCIDGLISHAGELHSVIEVNARASLGLAWLNLANRYAPTGFGVVLAMIRVAGPAIPFRTTLQATRDEGALPTGKGDAGVIFLTARTAAREGGGRFVVAIVERDDALEARRAALIRALSRAGYAVSDS